ncbi:MAG: hypothetical protein PHI59_08615, partial [Candidatus Omnitrophica bacterium]|nr:hypothetical protein [Candidatus Omnitrophota bacterium]
MDIMWDFHQCYLKLWLTAEVLYSSFRFSTRTLYDMIFHQKEKRRGSGLKTFRGMASYIKRHLLNGIELFSPAFDVDIVYCYADNKDPERLRQRQSLASEIDFENAMAREAISERRFNDYGEFRYSLRSVVKFAPWFRNLYIITSTPKIAWLRP